ncbi:MAG: EamA family transporter [Planctomycetota bacterium]
MAEKRGAMKPVSRSDDACPAGNSVEDGRNSRAGARIGVVAAFAAIYLIWGSTYLAIRLAVETIPPLLMAGVRFTIAGLVVYMLFRARGGRAPTAREWRAATIAGALLFLGGGGALAWGEETVSSGTAALLVAVMPLWMVLLNAIGPNGERINALVLAGIGLGFVGVAVLMAPRVMRVDRADSPAGAIVILVGTVSWAAGSIYMRRSPLASTPMLAGSTELLCGGMLLIVAGLFAGEWGELSSASISVSSSMALAYLIVFGSLIAFFAYRRLLSVSTPAKVSTHAFVNPLVAVLLGWLVGDERLTVETLLAAPLVFMAVIVITIRNALQNSTEKRRVARSCRPCEREPAAR